MATIYYHGYLSSLWFGGAGADLFLYDGDAGSEIRLIGGLGNDVYEVGISGDFPTVVENANEGVDTILLTSYSDDFYELPDNVDNLILVAACDDLWLEGNALNNLIVGLDGSDTIDGGAGADTMQGGEGCDVYFVGAAGDVIVELADGGYDSVITTVSYTLGAFVEEGRLDWASATALNLTGNASDNELYGNDLNNIISGAAGNDYIEAYDGNDSLLGGAGNDDMFGGEGQDTLRGDAGSDSLDGGFGNDSLDGGTENDTLDGGFGNDTLDGGAGDDVLLAGYSLGADNDKLIGGAGNDTLDGGWGDGSVTLDGGAGDDVYYVGTSKAPVIIDSAGDDTIELYGWYDKFTMANGIENLLMSSEGGASSVVGNTANNLMVGNDDHNRLEGLAGNDVLDGGEGWDTLIGGTGDDKYVVDSGDGFAGEGDQVIEAKNEGTDTVYTSSNGYDGNYVYQWTLGANLENLVMDYHTRIGRGNELNNLIVATGFTENRLEGGAGNDTLDGGACQDTLIGGAGNDTYVVDNQDDRIIELSTTGSGTLDTVLTTASYTLSANVELLLAATGVTSDLRLTGNASANTIAGGAGSDTLIGGAGADSMAGGAGSDTYDVDNAGDKVTELANGGHDRVNTSVSLTAAFSPQVEDFYIAPGAGNISVAANALDNFIMGNAGANTLDGGAGNDTLMGGAGNDKLMGGAGNDSLDGGLGADSMDGGAGNDTYIVDSQNEVSSIVDSAGTDRVVSGTDVLLLNSNIEQLQLVGNALKGAGNDLANLIVGNNRNNELGNALKGADTLDGGWGADTMIGGDDSDTYIVDNVNDNIVEGNGATSGSADTVRSTVSFNLTTNGQNVENLVLLGGEGSNAYNGTGDGGKNTITGNENNNYLQGLGGNDTLIGNDGNDTLDGGLGVDSLVGGAGDDTYYIDGRTDVVAADSGGTYDTVYATFTGGSGGYLMTAGIEEFHLSVSGTTAAITGNELNNLIVGDFTAANTLIGGAGNDTLDGGEGIDSLNGGVGDDLIYGMGANDRLIGDAGSDTLYGGNGNDTLDGGAGNDWLDGGNGSDSMVGGAGNDTIVLSSASDIFVEVANGGTDTLIFDYTPGADSLSPSVTLNAQIENARLQAGGNLTGNGGNNVIDSAGNGATTIDGGAGNDVINHDDSGSSDMLAGGLGNDTLNLTLNSNEGSVGASGFEVMNLDLENGYSHTVSVAGNSLTAPISVTGYGNLNLTGLGDTFALTLNDFEDAGGHLLLSGDGNDVLATLNLGDDVGFDLDIAYNTVVLNNSGDGNYVDVENVATDDLRVTGTGDLTLDGIGSGMTMHVVDFAGDGLSLIAYDGGTLNLGLDNAGISDLSLIGWETVNLNTTDSASDAWAVLSAEDSDGTLNLEGDKSLTLFDVDYQNINVGTFAADSSLFLEVTASGSKTIDAGEGTSELHLSMNGSGDADVYFGEGLDQHDSVMRHGEGSVNVHAVADGVDAGSTGAWHLGSDETFLNSLHITSNGTSSFDGTDVHVYSTYLAGEAGSATFFNWDASGQLNAGDYSGTLTAYVTSQGESEVIGGSGNDTIVFLDGGEGYADGGIGDDSLVGGVYEDTLVGGAGNDFLDGGDDSDWANYNYSSNGVTVDLEAGLAVGGGGDNDVLSNIENVEGSDYDDQLIGNSADNELDGGEGADTLSGGNGHDTLDGGEGEDVFIFDTPADNANSDVIVDFAHGDDKIYLSLDAVPAFGGPGWLGAASLLLYSGEGVDDASGGPGQFLKFNQSTGDLYYDADANGTGGAGPQLIATLQGVSILYADSTANGDIFIGTSPV